MDPDTDSALLSSEQNSQSNHVDDDSKNAGTSVSESDSKNVESMSEKTEQTSRSAETSADAAEYVTNDGGMAAHSAESGNTAENIPQDSAISPTTESSEQGAESSLLGVENLPTGPNKETAQSSKPEHKAAGIAEQSPHSEHTSSDTRPLSKGDAEKTQTENSDHHSEDGDTELKQVHRDDENKDDGDGDLKMPLQHTKLDWLLSQIPKKAQHGLLMQCDLILTCLDVNDCFIALGTNIGLTFLFNRKDHSMQRLKSETTSDVITCIKLHHGVDHQLATGMASGALCIFLIPSFMSLHKKQLQKFDVRSVHRHYVTCVEWSTNGMKLFSGDKTGHVVTTEVDFYQGQCKSSVLLIESSTEVVQLNYDHKVLLVSTKHRSFICRLDAHCQVVQVGQQDRKVQGSFGACFLPGLCKTDHAKLYAARPGFRTWLANIQGEVLNTHIFKDGLSGGGIPEIPILSPSKSNFNPNTEKQFGRLLIFQQHQLVTFNTTSVFVLDPERNLVVGSQSRLGGVVDVAVFEDEVFVLRRHADDAVVRVSVKPEPPLVTGLQEMDIPFSLASGPVTSSFAATTIATLTGRMATGVTTITTASPAHPTTTTTNTSAEEENKAKAFFKKTFVNPFKKLETFVQEHKSVSKEPNLNPVIRSAPGAGGASAPGGKATERGGRDLSPDLPPVVTLMDSPGLTLTVWGQQGQAAVTTPAKDIQSPDSADSAISAFASEQQEQQSNTRSSTTSPTATTTPPMPQTAASTSTAATASGPSDIVFTHQMKKNKGKKKKGKGKDSSRDPDSMSQSSFTSQHSGGDNNKPDGEDIPAGGGNVDDALRRADEALSSVDKLLKGVGEGEQKNAASGVSEQGGTAQSEGPGVGEKSNAASEKQVMEQGGAAAGGKSASAKNAKRVAEQLTSGDSKKVDGMVDSTHKQPQQSSQAEVNGSGSEGFKITDQPSAAVDATSVSGRPPLTLATQSSSDNDSVFLDSASKQGGKQKGEATPANSMNDGAAKTAFRSSASENEADALAAAEQNLTKLMRSKGVLRSEDSVDDFYSKFDTPLSPTDPEPQTPVSAEHKLLTREESKGDNTLKPSYSTGAAGSASDKSSREATLQRLANTWSEFTAPANIYSLGLSSTHVWFTDKSENLYYSALSGSKGILWRKVGESASQIAVSPSGCIVWRLHKGRVFAGTKITHRHPEGMKWVEAVRDVAYMSVDDTCAWFIKSNGDVMMQRNLSKERPCFRSYPVESEKQKFKVVMARYGVVWAITDAMKLLVRTGISVDVPHGTAWQVIERQSQPFLFSNVTVDNDGIGWAVDVLGQIWFTDGISPRRPAGSGNWWQVPLSEYFVQDPSALDMLRSVARKFDPQKLSLLLSTNRGGLIVAGEPGVWLSLDYLNTLYVCRGSLQGYHWSLAQPSKMSHETLWKQVCASAADVEWGLMWAQTANGEMYAIERDSTDALLIPAPIFVAFAVNEHAVWGLTIGGEIAIRSGMGQHCPKGVEWIALDLTQLGDVLLVHLSCNSSFVWVVDADGQVFHRIGAAALRPGQLNPVWLPIDTYSEIVFTKVVNSPKDWMVWAVDNRRLTYVRMGVSDEMPIGKEWMHVPGIQAIDLTVSSSGVWALNTSGEIMFRYGIAQDNVSGDYWKKIPGCFTKISASPKDMLCAVNTEGQLMKCSTRHLFRRQDSQDPLLQRNNVNSVGSDEGDWELV